MALERVLLKTKKGDFTGFLMPRGDFDRKGFVTLKLDSGYNMSIRESDIKKKEILGRKRILEKFPKARLKARKGLPEIAWVSTGGTIASRVDYEKGGVRAALSPQQIMFAVPEIQEHVNIRSVKKVFDLSSEDIFPEQWVKLARAVSRELNSGARGVVVTHGTDTMHYTAAALSFMVDSSKPIILTGAQRSADRGSSDAFLNLFCSAIAAGKSDLGEVAVVFHESLEDEACFAIRGTRARKMHTERRDAFRPINSQPLLRISREGSISKLSGYRKFSDDKSRFRGGFEGKTALVKAYPGCSPEILDHYSRKGFRGLIIEGTGFGHVPTSTISKEDSWIGRIRKMANKGVFVGITSQAIYGRTNSRVYKNLRILSRAGAVHLGDMLPETAYVKLGWALSREKDFDKVKELMLTNVAGEISERTSAGWFLS